MTPEEKMQIQIFIMQLEKIQSIRKYNKGNMLEHYVDGLIKDYKDKLK